MSDHTKWSDRPDTWPHTPPLAVYRELEAEDDNIFWAMASGHAKNLLEDACRQLDEAHRLLADIRDYIRVHHYPDIEDKYCDSNDCREDYDGYPLHPCAPEMFARRTDTLLGEA